MLLQASRSGVVGRGEDVALEAAQGVAVLRLVVRQEGVGAVAAILGDIGIEFSLFLLQLVQHGLARLCRAGDIKAFLRGSQGLTVGRFLALGRRHVLQRGLLARHVHSLLVQLDFFAQLEIDQLQVTQLAALVLRARGRHGSLRRLARKLQLEVEALRFSAGLLARRCGASGVRLFCTAFQELAQCSALFGVQQIGFANVQGARLDLVCQGIGLARARHVRRIFVLRKVWAVRVVLPCALGQVAEFLLDLGPFVRCRRFARVKLQLARLLPHLGDLVHQRLLGGDLDIQALLQLDAVAQALVEPLAVGHRQQLASLHHDLRDRSAGSFQTLFQNFDARAVLGDGIRCVVHRALHRRAGGRRVTQTVAFCQRLDLTIQAFDGGVDGVLLAYRGRLDIRGLVDKQLPGGDCRRYRQSDPPKCGHREAHLRGHAQDCAACCCGSGRCRHGRCGVCSDHTGQAAEHAQADIGRDQRWDRRSVVHHNLGETHDGLGHTGQGLHCLLAAGKLPQVVEHLLQRWGGLLERLGQRRGHTVFEALECRRGTVFQDGHRAPHEVGDVDSFLDLGLVLVPVLQDAVNTLGPAHGEDVAYQRGARALVVLGQGLAQLVEQHGLGLQPAVAVVSRDAQLLHGFLGFFGRRIQAVQHVRVSGTGRAAGDVALGQHAHYRRGFFHRGAIDRRDRGGLLHRFRHRQHRGVGLGRRLGKNVGNVVSVAQLQAERRDGAGHREGGLGHAHLTDDRQVQDGREDLQCLLRRQAILGQRAHAF